MDRRSTLVHKITSCFLLVFQTLRSFLKFTYIQFINRMGSNDMAYIVVVLLIVKKSLCTLVSNLVCVFWGHLAISIEQTSILYICCFHLTLLVLFIWVIKFRKSTRLGMKTSNFTGAFRREFLQICMSSNIITKACWV